MSRDALNAVRDTVITLPFTTFRPGRRVYATHVLVRAPEGGLAVDSVVLGEQIRNLAKVRLLRHRGALSSQSVESIEQALLIALDLPGQR